MLQLPRCDHGLCPCGPSCNICFWRDPVKPRPREVAALLACQKVLDLRQGWGEKSLYFSRPQCPQLFAHKLRKSEKLALSLCRCPARLLGDVQDGELMFSMDLLPLPLPPLQAFPTIPLSLTLSLWPGACGQGQSARNRHHL